MYHINKEITGSGENIALKNTARHYFKDFNILGNSVKEGTPSIDSEAPIESVGDNINLFDKDKATANHYVLNTTGVLVASQVTSTSDYIEVKANKPYTISYNYNTLQNTGGRAIALYNKEKTFLSGKQFTISDKKVTITPTEDGYMKFSYDNNCFDIKAEQNSKATPYSPYGQGSVGIKQANKNFLDMTNAKGGTSGGITCTVNNNGSYSYVGTATSTAVNVWLLGVYSSSDTMPVLFTLKAGTYYVKDCRLYNKKSNVGGTKDGEIITLTEDTNITGVRAVNAVVGTNYNETLYPIIALSNALVDFIQHQSQTKALYTQQPFRAIGDVKDRFVKQNRVWYEEHKINHLVFNGTENWGLQTTKEKTIIYKYYNPNIFPYDTSSSLSNYFRDKFDDSDTEKIVISQNQIYLAINKETAPTVEDFKAKLTELYNAGTPLYVDYLLATPILIECTAEQVEQLEYFEKQAYSYDEVTHIYSTDEVSPYFEVTAYQRISEEFKTRLKEGKITRGYLKVLATDTLPEIIIDENNYLKDLKIEELRYVPEEGIIGGTVAKRVSGNFNNVDSSFNIQDREIEVYLGVELEDETTEYIKYGTYIVQRPEDDQVNDNTSFEALDYMIKFNQEYKDRITYPCTLKQLLDDIVDQAGVNSKVATFANSDFVVENNQFEQGSTLRDVLKAITQIAFNWSRIDADDNLVMDFETREETDEELGTDDYFSFKKSDDYGPVNVVVLRNSQVEGENVTIKDEELINLPTNKNICPNDWIYGQYAPLNGSIGIYENRIRQKKLLKVKPNTEYYLNTFNDDYEIIIRTFLKDKTFSRNIGTLTPFMTNSEEYYIGVTIYSPSDNISALLELVNDNTIKPFICLNSEEDKTYIPFKAVGEIEYVISDNPFAYTELKRKQLIEAGKRLFGFKYTPMTVDMLGLMYLNSKDRISVENLNGQKYSTYLFDHTIDYTGIVLDSMESKSKSKTETKYQYVSSLAQGLSHVEIKVDKANKRIESIIESQEDVSEKVAKTVARIEVVYALSDSPTEAPTDDWDTKAPPWENGRYMWQKTITTYANGSTAETAPTNISGAQGKDGVSGNNSYSYVAFANSADGSKDFSRTDSTNKTYIGTLTINESVNENLLRNTNKGTTNWGFQTQNGVVSKEQYTEEGKNAVKLTCTTASTGWQYASYSIGTDTLKRLKENSNYILSFDIKTNIGPSTLEVAIKKEDSTNAISQGVKADILGDETWEHFSVQLKTISDFSNITIGGQVVYFIGMNKVGYYIIENLKLEEGYRETSYSKSPEDLANDYTQYYWQYTKGEEGVGVKSVIDQYYSSTSSTELAGGEWKETQDTLQTDRFIWTRSKITWTNESVTYTDPILANTLNDINSNIIVFKDFKASQESTNEGIKSKVEETTKKLNDEYLTADKVNEKIDKIDDDYAILESRVAQTELDSKSFKVSIETIQNTGVDKIKTSMGYTFNDDGLNIDRTGSDTSTVIDEAKIKVTDKTGGQPKSLLYAGYVKEGDTEFSDYEGQTIVATSNLIVQNFLIIGSNSRFQDYYNETLGGNGTGAFDI